MKAKQALLFAILASALALGLANAILLPGQGGDLIVSDMQGYDRAALALWHQEPLAVHTVERYIFHPLGSDTYHPPGYYYFLTGIYALAGHSYLAVRMAQAVLGALTCWLIYRIGLAVFGTTVGLLAAASAALYPPLIFYSGVLLTETLATCLLSAATLSLLGASRSTDRRRIALMVLTGGLLGLAGLTRSVLLSAVPFALLWLWLVAQPWPSPKRIARDAIALLLPVVLVIAPITARNYQIHHRFVLISTNGGVNFFLGHGGSERKKNEVRNIPSTYTQGQLVGISSRTATAEEAYFYQLGWEYIRRHPVQTLRSIPARLCDMYWSADYWPATDLQARFLRSLDQYVWKAIILLACLGLALLRKEQRPGAALLWGMLVSSLSVPLVFWVQTRFRIPFVPFFMILAAAGAIEAGRRLRRRVSLATQRITP